MSEEASGSSCRPQPYRKCYQESCYTRRILYLGKCHMRLDRAFKIRSGRPGGGALQSREDGSGVCTQISCVDGRTVGKRRSTFDSLSLQYRYDCLKPVRVAPALATDVPTARSFGSLMWYSMQKGSIVGQCMALCRRASTSSAGFCEENLSVRHLAVHLTSGPGSLPGV